MKYAKGSFIVVPNKDAIQGLSGGEQSLFMWLCSYADEKGGCFPSRTLLAKNIGASLQTVDKHLRRLCEAGLIKKQERFKDGRQTSNLYQIMLVTKQGVKKTCPGSQEIIPGEGQENTTQNETYGGTKSIQPRSAASDALQCLW